MVPTPRAEQPPQSDLPPLSPTLAPGPTTLQPSGADEPAPAVHSADAVSVPGSGVVVEWVIDLLMGLALTVLAVGSVMVPDPLDARQYPPPDLRLAGLAVLASLPLVLRRRFPATVLVVSLGAWLTIWLLGWAQGVVPACTLFALYAAAAYQPLRRALISLGLMLAGVTVAVRLDSPEYSSWPLDLVSLVGFSLVWGVVCRYGESGSGSRPPYDGLWKPSALGRRWRSEPCSPSGCGSRVNCMTSCPTPCR
ncbi:hypothetical protein EV646_1011217 [Kribbella antiqua]|uniref:DUF7134 domain-containing protein n=1 Tax=Kribbella antiqua TaxID=2512217 RepID=A0A4R2J8P4_9ACTN|nr:hypothetical protein [Kribbella antiqua]TCO52219.1 hypothetical protein EV646_1011217 [Kribbella antiqua]